MIGIPIRGEYITLNIEAVTRYDICLPKQWEYTSLLLTYCI